MNSNQNNSFKSFSSFLSSLSPLEFTTLGCLIGWIITPQLNTNEQNSIGNFFELVGQVILTAQAQEVINTSYSSTNDLERHKQETNQKFNFLLNEINKLKKS